MQHNKAHEHLSMGLSKGNVSTSMDPVSAGRCPLFHALLQTHTEVCFLTNVGPTMVILLSWLFGAFSPCWDVVMT